MSVPPCRTALVSALLLTFFLPCNAGAAAPTQNAEPDHASVLETLRDRVAEIEREMTRLDFAALERPARHRLRATLHQLDRHTRRLEFEGVAEIRREIARLDAGLATGALRSPPPPISDTRAEPAIKGAGGGIGGTVTDAETGVPLEGIRIEVSNEAGYYFGSVSTGVGGHFLAGGLSAGAYLVVASDSYDDYVTEIYDNEPCSTGAYSCDVSTATSISVTADGVTGAIDFALDRSGSITGSTTDADTGDLISTDIYVWDSDGVNVGFGYSFGGTYRISGLAEGTYFVTSSTYGYLDESYDDIPCPGGPFAGCDPRAGTPVSVSLGTETSGIDFALRRLGAIEGRVVDATSGAPVQFGRVYIFDHAGNSVTSDSTNSQGHYMADGLDGGTYFAVTYTSEFADELYDDFPCPGVFNGGCNPIAGTPIAVSLGATADGIDFALDPLAHIAGRVRDAATGAPIGGVQVRAYRPLGSLKASSVTDGAGRYTIGGLDTNYVFVSTSSALGYLDQLYDGVLCEEPGYGAGCDPTKGEPIAVASGATTYGIDFDLSFGGTVSGTVRHALYGNPLGWSNVTVYDQEGNQISLTSTDLLGRYQAFGLPPGSYFVQAQAYGFLNQLYEGIDCQSYCDPTAGTPIAVGLGEDVIGIDFALRTEPFFTGGFESATTSAWSDFVPGVR